MSSPQDPDLTLDLSCETGTFPGRKDRCKSTLSKDADQGPGKRTASFFRFLVAKTRKALVKRGGMPCIRTRSNE
jgi:hypothetical protein